MAKLRFKVVTYSGQQGTQAFEDYLNESQPDAIESLIWSPKEGDEEVGGFMVVLRWGVKGKRGVLGKTEDDPA
jgi:hypothetical protein